MEINPRAAWYLWKRIKLGIDEPLMNLKIPKGEEVEAIKGYPVGVIIIDPVEDMLALAYKLLDLLIYRLRIGFLGKIPIDPSNPPMTLKGLTQSYKKTYFNRKKKVFNPYFRYFFQDPLVSLLWWFQFSTLVLRGLNQLGR